MRVGITGSTGMIGTALSARLASAGHEVVPLARTSAREPQETGWNPAAGWIAPGAFEGCEATSDEQLIPASAVLIEQQDGLAFWADPRAQE